MQISVGLQQPKMYRKCRTTYFSMASERKQQILFSGTNIEGQWLYWNIDHGGSGGHFSFNEISRHFLNMQMSRLINRWKNCSNSFTWFFSFTRLYLRNINQNTSVELWNANCIKQWICTVCRVAGSHFGFTPISQELQTGISPIHITVFVDWWCRIGKRTIMKLFDDDDHWKAKLFRRRWYASGVNVPCLA